MPDLAGLIESFVDKQVAWHLKEIAKAQKRLRRLRRSLKKAEADGPGPVTEAIEAAIKTSEAYLKWQEEQLKKLLNP